ncbi:MAG: three-Cys-motif partner protein TcmP [Armatimonadetes bacterium]|nr:three-Cys-motif partner protein TcmP [Armatimonadota bacterium]
MAQLSFGGDWTKEKLERVQKYLVAYRKVTKNQPFQTIYIDAFAGMGYCCPRQSAEGPMLTIPGFAEAETQEFLKGSVRLALEVEPPFSGYIFIEKDSTNCAELSKLKQEFPDKQISIINEDANRYVKHLCSGTNWRSRRAVMFLDPYGMQVSWDTVKSISETGAIDMWYLFPLGVAVSRLLKTDGVVEEPEAKRLDDVFGTKEWQDAFYELRMERNLFGERASLQKTATFDSISRFLIDRLETIFPGVAKNPLPLFSSKNVPLYLLCFAAANERGARIAIKIAQHILRR